jgi:hypothetical protein
VAERAGGVLDKLTLAGDPDAPLRHVVELEEAIQSLSEPELLALERFNNRISQGLGYYGTT